MKIQKFIFLNLHCLALPKYGNYFIRTFNGAEGMLGYWFTTWDSRLFKKCQTHTHTSDLLF